MNNSIKIYSFSNDFNIEDFILSLEQNFNTYKFGPLTADEDEKYGFTTIFNSSDFTQKIEYVNESIVLKAQRKFRTISSSTLDEAVLQRWHELEQKHPKDWAVGKEINGVSAFKQRTTLVQQVSRFLLSQALPKFKNFDVIILKDIRKILVMGATWKQAEEVISALRSIAGTLKCKPISVEGNMTQLITDWSQTLNLPEKIEVHHGPILLKSQLDKHDRVSYTSQLVSSREVSANIESHRYLSSISLRFDDKLTMVVNDDLSVGNIKHTAQFKETLKKIKALYAEGVKKGEFCYDWEKSRLTTIILTINEFVLSICSNLLIETSVELIVE